jgi:hypothetical protein
MSLGRLTALGEDTVLHARDARGKFQHICIEPVLNEVCTDCAPRLDNGHALHTLFQSKAAQANCDRYVFKYFFSDYFCAVVVTKCYSLYVDIVI